MQTNNFRVTVVEEYDVVEICGALKVSFYHKTGQLAGKVGFLPALSLSFKLHSSLSVLQRGKQICHPASVPLATRTAAQLSAALSLYTKEKLNATL